MIEFSPDFVKNFGIFDMGPGNYCQSMNSMVRLLHDAVVIFPCSRDRLIICRPAKPKESIRLVFTLLSDNSLRRRIYGSIIIDRSNNVYYWTKPMSFQRWIIPNVYLHATVMYFGKRIIEI